jgi:hypothetical protein
LGIKSGEGRWSWFPITFLVSILSRKVIKSDFIYTTGGPASPHIVGILIGKIFNKRVVCELQDPLSGKDIGRNSFSAMGLKIIESFIINNSTITLFCTRNAMLAARDRYKSRASNIDYVYPGSNKTKKVISIGSNVETSKINITYLGSLYQTRNIDSLMTAIKLMNQHEQSLIEINLYGHLNPDIKQRILEYKESSINMHGMVSRTEALKKGELADVLLLVQHSDERSITTMPFKTYDYLHSGKLILGLIFKNDEIKEILISHGHLVCQVDDIQAIQQAIRKLIENKKMLIQGIKECDITPKIAVKKMLTYFN